MKRHRKLALLLLFMGLVALIAPSIVAAATTSMTVSSQHVTEGSSVNIVLTLRGYPASMRLSFVVNVTSPSGSNSASNKTIIVDASGNGVITMQYPSRADFSIGPMPNTNLTGTYTANVTAVSTGAMRPSGTVSFTTGLTDRLAYQRTLTVMIQAAGYLPGKEANVTIVDGAVRILSKPRLTINSLGFVIDSAFWKIPATADATGTYTVTVTGNASAVKSPPDLQTFKVNPAILSVANIFLTDSSGKAVTNIVRGNTTFAVYNVTYPDGSPVTASAATSFVSLVNPSNSSVPMPTAATYNPTLKAFFTTSGYPFPVSAPTGSWTLRVRANMTNDNLGNAGPIRNATVTFTVGPLTLKTSITSLKTTFNRTTTFSVNATISYPTTDIFGASSGSVYANLTSGTDMIQQKLVFAGANRWIGNLTIRPTFPTGSATLQVSARDNFGNSGTNTAYHVTITPTTIIIRSVRVLVNGTSVNGTTIQPLQGFSIQINATYFYNQTENVVAGPGGLVKITFPLPNGQHLSIGLTVQSNGSLTGQYTIRETDALGDWNFTLRAWQFNDGWGNVNSKGVLGPVVTVIPIALQAITPPNVQSPGNIIVTGDKVNVGVGFRYPNSTLGQNLIVNGTVLMGGSNVTFTFHFDTTAQRYLATIDTTGWQLGQYQLNVYAYSADYRGYQAIQLTVQPTPFLIGPVVGGLLILIILVVGAFEYIRRRGRKSSDT